MSYFDIPHLVSILFSQRSMILGFSNGEYMKKTFLLSGAYKLHVLNYLNLYTFMTNMVMVLVPLSV